MTDFWSRAKIHHDTFVDGAELEIYSQKSQVQMQIVETLNLNWAEHFISYDLWYDSIFLHLLA